MRWILCIALALSSLSASAAQQYDARDFWPITKDKELLELGKKKLLHFKHEPAYQFAPHTFPNAERGVLQSSKRNPGIPGRDPTGRASGEFPWSSPAGLHQATGFHATRFVHLPSAITYRQGWVKPEGSGDSYMIFTWSYPVGTVFVECLTMDAGDTAHLWQLRTRTKTTSGWVGKVYSPFQTLEDIKKVAPIIGTVTVHIQNKHRRKIIDKQQVLVEVGEVHPRVLDQLEFKRGAGVQLTTGANRSIVPRGYLGIPGKCSSCHQTAGLPVGPLDTFGRDWYGGVEGSDEAFSFHIFDPASINHDGGSRPLQLNQYLLRSGLLKPG